MKVLLLIKSLGHGGAEQLLMQQVQRNTSVTYEVATTMPRSNDLTPRFEAAGITVHRLGGTSRLPLAWVRDLRRLVGRGDIDVMHSHLPLTGSVARLVVRSLSRSRRPPLMYTEHNRWGAYRLPTRWLNRLTIRLDTLDLAVSADAAASMGWPAHHPVEVLHHGVNVDELASMAATASPLAVTLGLGDQAVTVVSVANLRREKNLSALVRALTVLPDHVHAVIAGTGQGAEELPQLAQTLGVGDRAHFLGYRPDARQLIAGADVFCLPSLHEGRPVALMEAMALGRPVVVTDAGGMVDMVIHDESGLVVPAGDDDALAAALTSLIDDPSRRTNLAQAALLASHDFDASHAFDTLEAHYHALYSTWRRKTAESQ